MRSHALDRGSLGHGNRFRLPLTTGSLAPLVRFGITQSWTSLGGLEPWPDRAVARELERHRPSLS